MVNVNWQMEKYRGKSELVGGVESTAACGCTLDKLNAGVRL